MEQNLSTADKSDIQQNFRRYIRLKERYDTARGAYVTTKASKIWIAGALALLFAVTSNFFLGVAAGMFGVYLYSLLRSGLKVSASTDGVEQLDRWFASKKLKFEGRILYFSSDEMLENPLDPFDDACYR
ncbi:MAG: hypothetical protein ACPGF7_12035 [Pontibacterium sp.]